MHGSLYINLYTVHVCMYIELQTFGSKFEATTLAE